MRTRFLLIKNPTSGRRRRALVDAVIAELQERGCHVDLVPDDGLALLQDSQKLSTYDAVIAAGGDGTIRTLLTTQAGRAVPLGLIPNGTGNVLAHEIGLKSRATVVADVLIAGPEQSVQTGTSDADPFLLMVGIGFDGAVVHGLNSGLKTWIGKAAYVSTVLRALARRPTRFTLEIDGASHSATWAVIANARHYGGNATIAPQAGLTKRSFEVVLFGSQSRFVRIRQLIALATGAIEDAPQTQNVSGEHVLLKPPGRKLLAQSDGDPVFDYPREVRCAAPLRLIVPRRFIR